MADAQSAMPVQATGNYSYRSTRLYGDGFLLVGDAYAFVDPVFSSGVYLAMNGAKHAEKVVAAYLDDDRPSYRRACREYRSEVHRKLNAFTWFIYRFTTPAMRDLFESPRNDWQVEQAVIAMLAGTGDGSPQIRRRLWVFRVIYLGYWLRRLGTSLEFSRLRRRANRVGFEDETIVS
jgi:2-polyprenyl-6-methoxyphenol hydroxylase-like FAD-dependent oxidoreductase